MNTEKFTLEYGVEYDGKLHYEGEMRLPTLEDRETALEETPLECSGARVNRHVWARTVTRLGDIPPGDITAELLASAVDTDYGIFVAAEDALRKKRKPVNATQEPSKSD